jgi:hypothetical protein
MMDEKIAAPDAGMNVASTQKKHRVDLSFIASCCGIAS